MKTGGRYAYTPAHLAAESGDRLDILQWMCNQNPSLFFVKNGEGRTIAHVAAATEVPQGDDHPNVLKWILDQNFVDITCTDNAGATVGHLAAANDNIRRSSAVHLDVLRCIFDRKDGAQLINVPDNNGKTPFHHAVGRDPNPSYCGTHCSSHLIIPFTETYLIVEKWKKFV